MTHTEHRLTGGETTRHGLVTAVVCLALAAVVAAMSSLNVALPDIARATHASQTELSWVVDAYSLVFASLLLPAGALGDRFGRRRLLLVGLVVFGLGSAVAMTVSSATALIALRAVLGAGAAMVMPATLSTITSTFPAERRAKAVGVWAGVAGAAAVLGVLSSGLLLQAFSWTSVFGLNVLLAAAAVIGVAVVVPESAEPGAPALDRGGALLSVAGLVAVVYSVIEAPTAGWVSTRTSSGLGLGIVLLAVFVGYELRQARPMLDPRVFTQRSLAAGSLSILVQFVGFFGFIFLVLQYLQIVRGDSALVAAVSMLPMAVTMMPSSRLAPRIAQLIGAARTCVAGLAVIAVAFVVLSRVDEHSSYVVLAIGLLLLGGGMGTAMTVATTAVTSSLPSSEQGVASAVNDLAREVGGALGIAVLGSVASAVYRSHLDVTGVPAALAGRARDSVAVATHSGGPLASAARDAFVTGMHTSLLAAAGCATLAAVGVGVLLHSTTDVPVEQDELEAVAS